MHNSGSTLRRICGGAALAVLAGATIAVPTAGAQPQCTAAGLSNAIGTVGSQTGGYLAGHPAANEAITNAGASADPEGAIRNYFIAHPQEWADLQRIAQPLRTLRQTCDVQVAPADIARLFDAMAR
ncbi:hemophore-related protein [Mycobacterium hubeiense]|uniref:hemophore-related protein n=1 Tax=Mycobacterium hubeiense TaxID=1867256 RepID=UPI000C7E89FC|nr:hemophore-related protein [Mycobacterium sp. QGD 101]